jgi:hypothetical protein
VRVELSGTLAVVAGLLLGCAQHVPPAANARAANDIPLEGLAYRFTTDPELNGLDAQVCFRGAPPPELVCGIESGAKYIAGAWLEQGASRTPIPIRGGRISLAAVPRDGCIGYRIDFRVAESHGSMGVARRGAAIVTNVALWLWRPARWELIREATAELNLPPGMQVLLPWTPRGKRYVLDVSTFAYFGFAACGRFEVERVAAPSATLDVAVLDGLSPATRSHVVPWLTSAARTASQPFGRFPCERGVIVVVPTPSGDPVRFGMAARGGGASTILLVSPDAELEPLVHDWIAVHEFSHLMHPFVSREDAWLSEGLATYYQEIARVRGGLLAESEAWRRIYDGSRLAVSAPGSLAEQSARMFESRAFPLVYWSGAAFALLADAELRRRSGGKLTLDDVMRELAACCAREPRPTPAREVIARMDRIAGLPVFSELLQKWVLGPRPPDLNELYGRLGLLPGPDGVRISGRGEEAWIRAAIMSAPAHVPDAAAAQR